MKTLATKVALIASFLLATSVTANAQNYRFGLSIDVVSNGQQTGLLVKSVVAGSPVANAGMMVGDVIVKSNAVTFETATSNRQAAYLLDASVDRATGGLPTTSARPAAHMEVLRHGQPVNICVYPIRIQHCEHPITLPPPVIWKPICPPVKPPCWIKPPCCGGVPTH